MPDMKIFAPSLCAALAIALPAVASADPSSCTTVRMGQPPWTDINVTDALAGTVLNAIGYQQKIEPLAVPIIYQALKSNQIDVFQGNWMPAQTHFVTSYKGDFETLGTNLTGAKFTLAVPDYVAAAGVHSIADLNKYADKFSETIYGIDPGAPANKNISDMIADNAYGLKNWSMLPSSEAAMLSEVQRDVGQKKWIVFLAWEPHPMNVRFHLTYLSGGEKYFGPDYGQATVYTLGRPGLAQQCPNLAHLFANMKYNVDTENALMVPVASGSAEAPQEAADYLKQNPRQLKAWLAGVTTASGQPALPVASAALGIK
jgi:glycine betaine/proline transport system substrate-binding protein